VEVTYQLEGEEYWRYSLYVTLKSPSSWPDVAVIYLGLPALGCLLIAYSGTTLLFWWLGAAAFALIWFVYRTWLWRRSCFETIDRSPADARQGTLTLDTGGYTLRALYFLEWRSWQGVTTLERVGPDLLFERGMSLATLLPGRAFASVEDASAFYAAAERYWGEARQKKEPPQGPRFARERDGFEDELSVSFELTIDDYLQFVLKPYYTKDMQQKIANEARGAVFVSLCALLFLWLPFGLSPRRLLFDVLSLVIAAMLCYIAGKTFWGLSHWHKKNFAHRVSAASPGMLGPKTIHLSQEALFVTSSSAEKRWVWGGLLDVRDTPEYLAIYESSSHAFIIPKRAFDSFEAAQAFFHAARGYLQQANSGALVDKPKEGSWPPAPSVRS
jgi:hypothetical protein